MPAGPPLAHSVPTTREERAIRAGLSLSTLQATEALQQEPTERQPVCIEGVLSEERDRTEPALDRAVFCAKSAVKSFPLAGCAI